MSITPTFHGHVSKAGKLKLDNRLTFDAYAKRLAGEPVELVLRKRKSKRSLDQSAYWWAVPVRMIAMETGEDPDAVHYALLGACWGWKPSEALRREIPVVSSSRKLTVDEFSHLIEWVGPFAMEVFGVSIPLPNEADYSGAA